MTSRRSIRSFTILVLLILAAIACRLPQSASSTPTRTLSTQPGIQGSLPTATSDPRIASPDPPKRGTPMPSTAGHQIATHRIYGIAGFIDRQTSQGFIPRGVNYSILVPVFDHYEDRLLGVGLYKHERIQADFAALSDAGYNTVRILLDGCSSGDGCIGLEGGEGLNPAYLDNMADLMRLAKEADLFLLVAINELPELGGYAALANRGADQNFAEGRNTMYLTAQGVDAAQQFWADLLAGLIERQAPTEVILGWELQAEQYFQAEQAPFSLKTGKVKPANGNTYDLANPMQKRNLAVDGLRYYIDQVRETILTYDPTALVSMGFPIPNAPNAWMEEEERYIETAALLEESTLDFFDFHASPGMGLSLAEVAENLGMTGRVNKPVIMGEAGAYTWSFPNVADGAIAIQDWIMESCEHGFSGWIYLGYYPVPAGFPDATWGFVDERNAILLALSPRNQPNACTSGVLPGRNLALNKAVTVSGALPDQTAPMAVDGDPITQWSAGAFPEQWIEIDLGAADAIGEIRLTVGQWPAGHTVHQLWVGSSRDSMRMAHEFRGDEFDFDVLSYEPEQPMVDIRFVRIVTTESPSWVSWREIEVIARFPGTPTPTAEAILTPTP